MTDEKGGRSLNILFFLTPKTDCAYLYDDFTIRQALERMESAGYAALPILRRNGEYFGTLTEGDLLWAIKNLGCFDLHEMEEHSLPEIPRRRDNRPVTVTMNMQDLITRAVDQNFVPVIDDKQAFIGIITRRAIMRYCMESFILPTAVR